MLRGSLPWLCVDLGRSRFNGPLLIFNECSSHWVKGKDLPLAGISDRIGKAETPHESEARARYRVHGHYHALFKAQSCAGTLLLPQTPPPSPRPYPDHCLQLIPFDERARQGAVVMIALVVLARVQIVMAIAPSRENAGCWHPPPARS
jgi:hypothetical protein